jgi:hypothetical protein
MGHPLAAARHIAHEHAGMRPMRHANKIIHVVLLTLVSLALTGCPDDKSSEETGPASRGETSGETGAKPEV